MMYQYSKFPTPCHCNERHESGELVKPNTEQICKQVLICICNLFQCKFAYSHRKYVGTYRRLHFFFLILYNSSKFYINHIKSSCNVSVRCVFFYITEHNLFNYYNIQTSGFTAVYCELHGLSRVFQRRFVSNLTLTRERWRGGYFDPTRIYFSAFGIFLEIIARQFTCLLLHSSPYLRRH